MFGDFSRFENDPEIGLNGIYLSQGSPILDSDWNEQVAALTDWITVVGRLSAGDTLRKRGFWLKEVNTVFEVSPGFALLSGRVIQSNRVLKTPATSGRFHGKLEKSASGSTDYSVYLMAMDRQPETTKASDSFRTKTQCRISTDWRIHFAPVAETYGVESPAVSPNHDPEYVSLARSFGDSSNLTPRLSVFWQSHDPSFAKLCSQSTVCMIECDVAKEADDSAMQFKVSSSPQNMFTPKEWNDPSRPASPSDTLTYDGSGCAVLDLLTASDSVWLELDSAESAFENSLSLFKNLSNVNTSVLKEYRYDPARRTLDPTVNASKLDRKNMPRCRVRVWNAVIHSGKSFPIVEHKVQADNDNGVRGDLLIEPGQTLLPGDRWYIPVREGMPDMTSGNTINGCRVFRAIAKLGTLKVDSNGTISEVKNLAEKVIPQAYVASPRVTPVDSQLSPNDLLNREAIENTRIPHLQPVAHRFDDSLHRLTGALNAARALTRHTPCKELATRVSYLPLRRWLASTYVHEIVDHDLDSFLAKVRRSVEVAPEDEHRFREQAALILEEANELAGRIPSGAELTRRPKDIV